MSPATNRVLIDTGPLVALLDPNDSYHAVCVEHARCLPETIFTCWPVVTEACYLLRHRPDLVERLLQTCHDAVYAILPIHNSGIREISGILDKYRDQQIDLADACLLHLANREQIEVVMTIDKRHFSLFRTQSGKSYTLIPNMAS